MLQYLPLAVGAGQGLMNIIDQPRQNEMAAWDKWTSAMTKQQPTMQFQSGNQWLSPLAAGAVGTGSEILNQNKYAQLLSSLQQPLSPQSEQQTTFNLPQSNFNLRNPRLTAPRSY